MSARMLSAALGCAALLVLGAGAAHAAPGDLDGSFDDDGRTTRMLGTTASRARDVVVLPSGRIVAAGSQRDGSDEAPRLVGFEADGDADTAFGDDSLVAPAGLSGRFETVGLAPSGWIIAAGTTGDPSTASDFLLAAYTPDGQPVAAFGDVATPGRRVTDLGAGMARITGITFAGNGDIIAGGVVDADPATTQGQQVAVARYTADGAPAAGFGTNGVKILDNAAPTNNAEPRAVLANEDGTVFVAGAELATADATSYRVDRLESDGDPDPTWGTGGTFRQRVGTHGGVTGLTALTHDAAGRLIAGGAYDPGSGSRWTLLRFNANASSFARTDVTAIPGAIADIATAGTALYATGYSGADMATARFTVPADADQAPALDSAFGGAGGARTDFGGTDAAFGLSIGPDGKPVVAGEGGARPDVALARFSTAAAPPPLTISVADASAAEGNAASDNAHLLLTVSLSAPSASPVTFTYSTANGTADASDFEPLADQPDQIPAGVTSWQIGVGLTEDTAVEPDEALTVTLANVSGATPGDVTATARILNDDSAPQQQQTTTTTRTPAPAPAPAPAPPQDTSRFIPLLGMTENRFAELMGLRPDRTKPIPEVPRQAVFDYAPYEASKKPRTGLVDPQKVKPRTDSQRTGKVRFWTVQEAWKDIAALNAAGVPVIATFRGQNQTQWAGHAVEPGEIMTITPTLRNQPLTTSFGKPAEIQLNYSEPAPPPEPAKAKPPTRGACEDLADDLGTSPRVWTPEVEELLERHRKRGCEVAVDFRSPSRTLQYSTLSVPELKKNGARAEMWMVPAQKADLALTVHSLGSTYTPSFDEQWRLSAGLGDRKNRFAVLVTDRGATPGKAGGPVSGVDLQFWLDRKSDGQTESTMLHEQRVDADGRAEVLLEIPREGTLRIEAIGKPRSGPSLHGWTEFPAVRRGACFRGVSGWSWSSSGVRQADCGTARAAAFDAKWKQDLCWFVCALLPPVRSLLETPEAPPAVARKIEGGTSTSAGQVFPTFSAQTALGKALSANPQPGTTVTAAVISTGGGNATGESSKVLQLNDGTVASKVIATGGGNATDITKSETRSIAGNTFIATKGGAVIAVGGGNLIGQAGGNLIGQAGGNLIGQAGGNLIGQAGGNVIATGGGNVISTGGGN